MCPHTAIYLCARTTGVRMDPASGAQVSVCQALGPGRRPEHSQSAVYSLNRLNGYVVDAGAYIAV